MVHQCTFEATNLIFAGECEALARDWLDNVYEPDMRALLEGYVQKDWEYNTDITDENAAESVRAFKISQKMRSNDFFYNCVL